MQADQTILEASFEDVVRAIRNAVDLEDRERRHWPTSLRSMARAFNQPLETIPARYSAVRARMAALHHVPLGWAVKTLDNHKSGAKAALLWFVKEKDLLPDGVPLSPMWDRLRAKLTDPSSRYRLLPLMRFCSGLGIEPEQVDEVVIDRYFDHRARTTSRPVDAANRRILARLWNAGIGKIADWPNTFLVEPPIKTAKGPTWGDFPEGLRLGIETELARLRGLHWDSSGQRIRPAKESTLVTRKRELVAAIRMAVRLGIPLESLTSLAIVVHPDVAERILDGYWRKDGEIPRTYTINLSSRFVGIAHRLGLDGDALKRLSDVRFVLEEYREEGMTPKNLALIRQVLTPDVWPRVVNLPEQLMRKARSLQGHALAHAAVLAQIAVAVAILTVAPVRLDNLTGIRLEEHLTKPGGPDSNYWLVFRKYDVKNRQPLQFKLDETVTAIIDEYVYKFRPRLLRGSNADWLFPGERGNRKNKISFSTQIVDRVEELTGIRITVHQFRHAAGALMLKHHPGNYELVRRILGHKSIETTRKFYCELDTTQASEIYAEIIRPKLDFGPKAA